MDTWSQRVVNNILPLSIAQTLPEAFKEWYFTDEVIDHEKPIEDCELCNKTELRYHFEISNKNTDETLWVGSTCIIRFQINVYDDDKNILDSSDAQKKLIQIKNKMRLDSCIKSLEKVADKENNRILIAALDYYCENKYLTPKFAFVVLWRLSANRIDHHPSFFKINLNRIKYKNDLRGMELYKIHRIWPALSNSQKQMAIKFGHTPPDKD